MTSPGAVTVEAVLVPGGARGATASQVEPVGKHCPACGERFPADYAVCPRDATPLQRAGAAGDDPLLGTVLGEAYEVVRLLGEGGMGRVYEARHVRLGRRFAVKVLHERFVGDPDAVARFRREATHAAAVLHPNVAQVVDVHATRDGRPYMVSELLDGEDLGVVLRRGDAIAIDRAVAIARQVCRGLAAAHAQGVVHRDLKPENVMLVRDDDGREVAKVLDFGIAKVVGAEASALTRTGVVLGTPAYMAPEQVRSSATIDHRVDVYAVGAMLYRAVTGRMPFAGEDPSATLASVLSDEPRRPKSLRAELPDGLELVIQRAMSKDPDARYASMRDLDAALAAFDAGSDPAVPALADAGPVARPGGAGGASAGAPRELGAAATVALPRTVTAAAALVASDSSRARAARPRAVAFAALLYAWTTAAAGALVAAAIERVGGRPLARAEAALVVVLAGVATTPVLVAWARGLVRGTWRNTAAMLARADALGRVAGVALGAYAVASVAARAYGSLWLRAPEAARPAEPWAVALALVAGAAAVVHQRRALRA